MSVMIEIYYAKPANAQMEEALTSLVTRQSGRVTFREDDSPGTICLTAEFDSWEAAQAACTVIRATGQHVEGPAEYGN